MQNKAWQSFFLENQNQYKEVFKNLAKENHPIQKDVKHFFNELYEIAPNREEKLQVTQLQTDFFEAMKSYRADEENNQKFTLAKKQFESYLEKLIMPWWSIYKSHKQDVEFKQGPDSALNLGTRIAKGLGIHSRV